MPKPNLLARIRNWFDGAKRFSQRRSYVPGFRRDTRLDINQMTRDELVRKSRYFEKNYFLYNKIVDVFECYTVGKNGLTIKPASEDYEWNKKAKRALRRKFEQPDLASKQDIGEVQKLISRMLIVDGDVFLYKTRGKSGRARIQFIESHRVSTPIGRDFANGRIIDDGVELDANGRAIAYWVRRGDYYSDDYERIEADKIIHIFDASYPNQTRGLPMCYPVINLLNDLDDLMMLEMDAAKDAASITAVVKTKTGELDVEDLRRDAWAGNTPTTSTSGGSATTRVEWYDQQFGRAKPKVLYHGDEWEQYVSNRPSVVTSDYWRLLIQAICVGMGVPVCLVFPAQSAQGTQLRMDTDSANTFFQSRSQVIAKGVKELTLYFLDDEIKLDRELNPRPVDWYEIKIGTPLACNVDKGNTANSQLALFNEGLLTMDQYYSPLGKDWMEEIDQSIYEQKYFLEKCRAEGVEPSMVRESMAQKMQKPEQEPDEKAA